MMNRLKALALLSECTGDDIWSLEHCRLRQVPQQWIEELSDCFESGFQSNTQTIYVRGQITNQYHGIRDVDLAQKLGEWLGLPVEQLRCAAVSRRSLVRSLQDAAEEL